VGRLFDSVGSLLDLRHEALYEGQGAMELEILASSHRGPLPGYRFGRSGVQIDPAPVIAEILGDLRRGVPLGAVAAGFHDAVAAEVAAVSAGLARATGIGTVALSGGVFQNTVLLRMVRAALRPLGVRVLTHRMVPPNDGGMALGQLLMAAAASIAGRDKVPRREW
jgi:hydrogenase maturation protein HypF